MKSYLTYLNEKNNVYKFNIGDHVICKKGIQDGIELGNKYGIIFEKKLNALGRLNGTTKNGIMYSIIFSNEGKNKWSFWVFEELIELDDIKRQEERKRKKEELRLKMKDIDPYGEEEWMDENKLYESIKPKFFNVDIVMSRHDSVALMEKELEDLVIGETCIWYTKANKLKRELVSSVEIDKFKNVFFNGFSVNKERAVEIQQRLLEKLHIIGLPSGEVIYVSSDDAVKLTRQGLVRYENFLEWGGNEYKNIYYFRDDVYHKIKKALDSKYEKPKKNNNVTPQLIYKIEDIIVCQGAADMLDVDMKIGKVIDFAFMRKEKHYLVEFLFHFNDMLHDGKGNINNKGNCWWLRIKNIKGLYTGDIGSHLRLKQMEEHQLEEHEIDDDYYLKNLFKNVSKN